MDHNQLQIFKNYFEYTIKKHEKITYNPPIRAYVSEIEKRITLRIKAGDIIYKF